MQATRDFSHYVKAAGAGLSHIDLAVEGVSCAGCMSKIERGLSAMPDVTLARVNLTDRRVALEWKQGALDPARFIDRLAELGYKAYPFETADAEAAEAEQSRFLLRCLGVAAFATMNVMMLSVPVWSGNVSDMIPEQRDFFHWLSALIALPAAAYAGQPFFRSALARAAHRQRQHGCADPIGVILALGMSVVETINHAEHAYFDAAIMLLTFLLVGRYLDQSMRRRTRAVAGNLAALKAETATKFVGADEISQVPVAAIDPGDIVLLRPGERCAVDGTVIEGRSEIDQSLITGETRHVTAEQGTAGLCRLAQHVRHAAGPGLRGVGRHAAGGDHPAARQCVAGPLALCAPRRPGLAALCAGGACHRAADDARLGSDGRELARCHRHRRRRSHHHLSLRAGSRHSDGADGGVRRDVQGRRAAQFRRFHRAARRGRPHHLRQDGHADAARSRSRQRRRYPRGRVQARRTAWRWRAIIRSPPRWRGPRMRNRRLPAPSRSPGRACAAISAERSCGSDGRRSAAAEQLANDKPRPRSGSLHRRLQRWRGKVRVLRPAGAAPGCAGDDLGAAEAQHQGRDSLGRPRAGGSGGRARAWRQRVAGGRNAGRQDRAHRGTERPGASR